MALKRGAGRNPLTPFAAAPYLSRLACVRLSLENTRGHRVSRAVGVFPLSESLPVDQSLEREIRSLYSCFHSPEDPQGRSFVPLADAYRRAGDLQRARLLLEEGLRRHPGFATAHVVSMRIARDVSDHPGALAATRRVLKLDPGNEEARQVLAAVGPLTEEAGDPAVPVAPTEGDAELPDESWMVGDAGVWGADTDSGLASVDPEALRAEEKQNAARDAEEKQAAAREAEEKQTAAREAEERQAAAREAEKKQTAARESEEEQAVAREAREKQAAARETGKREAGREAQGWTDPPGDKGKAPADKGKERGARSRATPAGAPSGDSGTAADAGIYTRTMGRLYEQQGLDAQAIAVYERLLESEPGDDELASHLARLSRRSRDEASGGTSSETGPGGELPGTPSAGSGASTTGDRSGSAGVSGVTVKVVDVASAPGDGVRVVPIEALAPDAAVAEARGETQ